MTINGEENLISKIVDEEATPEDWAALENLAESDPGVWRRLAAAQREQSALSVGVNDALAVCDEIALPQHAIDATHSFNVRWRSWSGWAAAAAIALVWVTTRGLLPGATALNPSQTAGIDPASWTPEQAFDQYLTRGKREGRVLSELPDVMVQSQPTPDGLRFEVIILRRVMERTVVDHLYSIGEDDAGQPRIVPDTSSPVLVNRPM
jgi:anti-sigma factor RsiW